MSARPAPAAPGTPGLLHSAFYEFVPLASPRAVLDALRVLTRELEGSIIVAAEGISGAVAGAPEAVETFEAALIGDPAFGGAFARIVFKRSACTTRPYAQMALRLKPEIVAFGVDGASGPEPQREDAGRLGPQAWRELLMQDDVVVIDNRNSFEYRLGRFRGAIDPGVGSFREFADYARAHAPAWKAAGQRVAMYCTGGIRCEKTAGWMRQELGLEVLQLDGGILNYCQTLPDADRDWLGECFVFDNRIALDARLRETPTTAAEVYDPARPDEAWRLERALRLDAGAAGGDGSAR
ncbi:rhodanese-like domain-containing protein [Caldimonas tepidiphila]|uniref:oxygen-dependent tRNA uridine(34) hydroxylase TrhO n=1 Tax=Caldimonas tepidiphila TaxID=2315841 RepID=UPI000E5B5F76|nr:rhodanese-like domain-containing protein [Caldimonas tepidiphila]